MAWLSRAILALDPAPDPEKQITLLLNLLAELCEQKVQGFEASVEEDFRAARNGENRTIPVTEILAKHREYRAYVDQDASKMAAEVTAAVKKFVSPGADDKLMGAIARLVTDGLQAMIAAPSVEQEMGIYFIVVQDFSIARYDFRVWARQIKAAGITSQIQTALALVALKSSVDIMKISFNTFLLAYGLQLAAMAIPPERQGELIQYAEKVFERLRRESTNSNLAPNRFALDRAYDNFPAQSVGFHGPGQFVGPLWT